MTKHQRRGYRFTVDEPGRIGFYHYDLPEPVERQFVVETLYSGVSAGTDLSHFRNTNPKHQADWDATRRLFTPATNGAVAESYPLAHFGDSQVGRVIESGDSAVEVGAVVAMDYGHRSHHLVRADDRFTILPTGLDPVLGIYVAKNGPVCANGVLYAADDRHRAEVTTLKDSLAGQRVAVTGAGAIGLLVAKLAQWAGAREVAVLDRATNRLAVATALGLLAVDSTARDPAVFLKDRWRAADSLDSGADLVFQCTGSDDVLALALRVAREQGTVVDLGFYPAGAAHVHFGNEFHHNRLRHICAQIGAVPRAQPRWNRLRLARETVVFLEQFGGEFAEHVITHRLPFSRAQSVYDALAAPETDMLQVVLQPDAAAAALATRPDPAGTDRTTY
jgi:threonine dehydrogenase-like Zn-dependent dehydrogenase